MELINEREDKMSIACYIETLLKHTRFGQDLHRIEYFKNDLGYETLRITWNTGYKEYINVTADSGIAMIIDVAKWLETK